MPSAHTSIRRDIYSVNEFADHQGSFILINCKQCRNQSIRYARDLAHEGLGSRPVWRLLFRCTRCGCRKIKGMPYIPFTMR